MANEWLLLTTADAAAQLEVTPDAVLRYYRSGILRGRKHGKYVLVEQRAVIALMKVIHQARHGKPLTPRQRAALGAGASAANPVPSSDSPVSVTPAQDLRGEATPASDNGLSQAG